MTLALDVPVAVAAAGLLALGSGANDGATIIALALPVRVIPPLVALGVLLAAILVVPFVVGVPVASTLTRGLVQFEPASQGTYVAAASVIAIAITLLSARRGLPTSLTLGLVGALVGVGFGAGQPVAWSVVAFALGVAAAAPVVAAGIGMLAAHVLRLASRAGLPPRFLPPLHVLGFGLQAVAYATNDGQKILAGLLASGAVLRPDAEFLAMFAGLLVLFSVGTLLAIGRVAARLGRGVVAATSTDALLTQAAASTAVLASAALGAPVSMTQSSAAALVGTGLAHGSGRVRWNAAARIVAAWVLTLPLAAAAGMAAGVVLGGG